MLANPRSDRIKLVRGLAGRAGRKAQGLILVEGPQAVAEAAAAGLVLDLYIEPQAAARQTAIVRQVLDRGGYVHDATAEVVKAISQDAQGVVATARWNPAELGDIVPSSDAPGVAAAAQTAPARLGYIVTGRDTGRDQGPGRVPWPARLGDKVTGRGAPGLMAAAIGSPDQLGELAPVAQPRLVAVFEEIRDPGNAGTVIRAADAAGADGVVLTAASVDATSPKVIRASAGSIFHLPVAAGAPLVATVTHLRQAGLQILAADGAGEVSLDDLSDLQRIRLNGGIDLKAPTAWLFGNEARGLSPEALGLADAVVRIPMYGRAESLNLAMAATICLFASARALAD